MTVSFELDGQQFFALNGGPDFTFNEAISFQVSCETQDEVDTFWSKLSEGGEEGPCGWLKDRFGVSWQIVPTALPELLGDPDAEKSQRVMAGDAEDEEDRHRRAGAGRRGGLAPGAIRFRAVARTYRYPSEEDEMRRLKRVSAIAGLGVVGLLVAAAIAGQTGGARRAPVRRSQELAAPAPARARRERAAAARVRREPRPGGSRACATTRRAGASPSTSPATR